MADDGDYAAPPIRLMTFVSQEELERSKKARGERVDDGTAQRDRPLYEILKENKEKKDTEFNERFKHRPPKALDEDEMEFLDRLEKSRKEHERQVADEEEEELQRFRKAVEAQSAIHELKEAPPPPSQSQPARPLGGLIISAKAAASSAASSAARSPLPGAGEKPQFSLVSYGDESEED
ncbi:unnamed protein product [Spirodela intermedia]|uniref:FAM192A/Fyv6 N-terminal domain-containing protein n=1 Tax=Spirodela intermedia TaxID=51605 RepID=A0A7I8IX06_SPIIN|nr:unnamed protein product [Spirodela intermedia]CAA6662214.1 unnamed protein product [Spirodela intermedia]